MGPPLLTTAEGAELIPIAFLEEKDENTERQIKCLWAKQRKRELLYVRQGAGERTFYLLPTIKAKDSQQTPLVERNVHVCVIVFWCYYSVCGCSLLLQLPFLECFKIKSLIDCVFE